MSYQSVLLATSPVRYFEDAGNGNDSSGNSGPAMVNRGTWDGTRGIVLNGTSQDAYIGAGPTQLAWGTNKIAIAFRIKPTSWTGVRVVYESSPDWSVYSEVKFICYGDGAGGLVVGMRSAAGTYDTKTYAQPTTGVFTDMLVVYDRSVTGSGRITLYVNGSAATPTASSILDTNTSNFATNYLYWGARNGASYFLAMTLTDVALWAGTVPSSTDAANIYAAGPPSSNVSLSRTAADSWAWSESLSRTTTSGTARTAADSWAWTDTAPRTRRQNVTVGQGYPGGEVYPGGATYPGGIGDHWAWYETATRGAVVHGGLERNAFPDTWTWADGATRTTSTTSTRTSADAWAWADSAGGPAYSLTTITHDTHTVAGTGGLTSTTTANQVTVAEISGTSPIPA